MESLLDQLRRRVETAGVSRYRIAHDTGIDAASLCRFMQGQTGLNVLTAEKLADYMGLEIVVRPKGRRRKLKGN